MGVSRPVLRFAQTRVAFKYSFDCGQAVEPLDAARKLLDDDLGVAAVGMNESDVFVAPRFARVSKATDLLNDLATIGEAPTARRVLGLLARRPRFAWGFVRSVIRRRESAGKDDAPRDGWWQETRDVAEELRRSVRDAPVLQQVAREFDRIRFHPDYLAELPFCRVQLNSVVLREPGGDALTFEVDAIIHRSGAVVLTFWWHDNDRERNVDDLIPLILGMTPRFVEASIVESAAKAADWPESSDVHSSTREYEGGVWWRTDTFERPVSWTVIAWPYMAAISRVLSGSSLPRSTAWSCYPVTFTAINQTTDQAVRDLGPRLELAGLVGRIVNWRNITPELVDEALGRDWSLHPDKSIYFHKGAFAVVEHGPSEGLTVEDFDWGGTVDHLLLRAEQARIVGELALRAPASPAAVHDAAAQLLLASRELLGRGVVAWGSLETMVGEADQQFGVDAEIEAAQVRLGLLNQVSEAQVAAQRSRRDTVLQLIAGLAAVIFGLPAIHQAVTIIGEASEAPSWTGPWGNSLVDQAGQHPLQTSVCLWLVVVFVVLAAVAWSIRTRRENRPLSVRAVPAFSGRFPYQWPDEAVRIRVDSPYVEDPADSDP